MNPIVRKLSTVTTEHLLLESTRVYLERSSPT
jgi:hypothetical protein